MMQCVILNYMMQQAVAHSIPRRVTLRQETYFNTHNFRKECRHRERIHTNGTTGSFAPTSQSPLSVTAHRDTFNSRNVRLQCPCATDAQPVSVSCVSCRSRDTRYLPERGVPKNERDCLFEIGRCDFEEKSFHPDTKQEFKKADITIKNVRC